MIITYNVGKAFDRTQHSLIKKQKKQLSILANREQSSTCIRLHLVIHSKPIANIIFKGEKLKYFLLRSGTGQMTTFTTFI